MEAWHGMAWHKTWRDREDMKAWHGMAWHGMATAMAMSTAFARAMATAMAMARSSNQSKRTCTTHAAPKRPESDRSLNLRVRPGTNLSSKTVHRKMS